MWLATAAASSRSRQTISAPRTRSAVAMICRPLQRRQQPVDGLRDARDEVRVRADQDRLRVLVVLGLREEVHRDPVRIRPAVANDQDLGRPGHHVDPDLPEHRALGSGDVDVAGADDLVDGRHRVRPVGQRRNGLRAPDGKDLVDAGHVRGGEHELVQLAARRRHHHDQLGNAGHLRRNGVHQHRRRIGGLATGHVEADAIERRHLLAQHRAVGLGVGPAVHASGARA